MMIKNIILLSHDLGISTCPVLFRDYKHF